jgi:hypothetical protein
MLKNNSWLAIQKIGTLLVDRRFWMYLISLGVILGVLPKTANADELGDAWVDGIMLVVQGATVLLNTLVLLYSYTKRPPSGLEYKYSLDTFLQSLMKDK